MKENIQKDKEQVTSRFPERQKSDGEIRCRCSATEKTSPENRGSCAAALLGLIFREQTQEITSAIKQLTCEIQAFREVREQASILDVHTTLRHPCPATLLAHPRPLDDRSLDVEIGSSSLQGHNLRDTLTSLENLVQRIDLIVFESLEVSIV